jgi:ribose transport system substrate-binding protein
MTSFEFLGGKWTMQKLFRFAEIYPLCCSLLAGAIWIGISGCAERSTPAAEGKLVFITNGDSSYWDAAEKGWTASVATLGRQGQFLRNKSADATGQIRLLDQIASRSDVAGMAISIVDASATGIIDRLKDLGKRIPIVTVDSDCRPEDQNARKAYVGTNNEEAGKVAGRIAKLLLPNGGKWIGFVGNEDADNARARIQGFIEGAGDTFVRLDVLQDQHDQGKARENVRASLNKDAALLFGIYSYNAPAIAEVAHDAGQRDKLKIITFDAEENTIRAIDAGQIDATIVQNTYDMGAKTAELLDAFAKGDNAKIEDLIGSGTELDTKVRVIVPETSELKDPAVQKVEEFKAYMAKMGLRST